ncbi:hypothetical protein Droror1_Dr00006818 [Drosera rotundifolia]
MFVSFMGGDSVKISSGYWLVLGDKIFVTGNGKIARMKNFVPRRTTSANVCMSVSDMVLISRSDYDNMIGASAYLKVNRCQVNPNLVLRLSHARSHLLLILFITDAVKLT